MTDDTGLLALTDELDRLAERVAVLEQSLEALISRIQGPSTESASAARPWCWSTFTAEQAEAAWRTLAGWVQDVLLPRYPDTTEPLRTRDDCWYRHVEVVEELGALSSPTPPPTGPRRRRPRRSSGSTAGCRRR